MILERMAVSSGQVWENNEGPTVSPRFGPTKNGRLSHADKMHMNEVLGKFKVAYGASGMQSASVSQSECNAVLHT